MNSFDLSGKAAIVTGGNDGIGRGIAIGLASAGAKVCIAGRDDSKNEKVRLELNKQVMNPSRFAATSMSRRTSRRLSRQRKMRSVVSIFWSTMQVSLR